MSSIWIIPRLFSLLFAFCFRGHFSIIVTLFSGTSLHIVRQIGAKIWWNCGIYGKSTKFATYIETYLLNNISYGPTWELSHNCSFSRFKVAHWSGSMEMRLRFCLLRCSHILASKERQSSKKWRSFQYICYYLIVESLWLAMCCTYSIVSKSLRWRYSTGIDEWFGMKIYFRIDKEIRPLRNTVFFQRRQCRAVTLPWKLRTFYAPATRMKLLLLLCVSCIRRTTHIRRVLMKEKSPSH